MNGQPLDSTDIIPALIGARVWSPAVGRRAAFTGTVIEVFSRRISRRIEKRWLHLRDDEGLDWHREASDRIQIVGGARG
jgi:hypothetical protein